MVLTPKTPIVRLSKDEIQAKHTLPSDWYGFTITQAYLDEKKEDPVLVLCHTVDTGDYAYQHVLMRFNLMYGSGKSQLKKMCDAIDFNWFVKDVYSKWFPEQFVNLRGRMSVEQVFDERRKIIYNTIKEWKIVEGDRDFNVMKDKDTKVFQSSEQKGKPKLPI